MKQLSFLLLLRHSVIAFCFLTSLRAQITQDHPELCGSQSAIPIPANITVTIDPSRGQSTLVFKGEKGAQVPIPGVMAEVQQICPVSSSEVVIFGVATPSLYNVTLADIQGRQVIDSFYAYNPVISPDQHWLIMRKFYPTGGISENVSEEYLLYDLKKNRVENRAPGIIPTDRADVGNVVYPLGQNNLLGDNIGLPESQVHHFRSATFFWAPDSNSVVFADSVQNVVSIVLILIKKNDQTTAQVHAVRLTELCATYNESFPMELSKVNFGASESQPLDIEADFTSKAPSCTTREVRLQFADFTPAATEIHTFKHGKRAIIEEQH